MHQGKEWQRMSGAHAGREAGTAPKTMPSENQRHNGGKATVFTGGIKERRVRPAICNLQSPAPPQPLQIKNKKITIEVSLSKLEKQVQKM